MSIPAICVQAQDESNQSASTTDSTSSVTISGRVVNAASGQPVTRALVRCNDRAMLTTSDGKFEFDQVTDANANLEVSKPGFYSTREWGAPSALNLRTSQINAPIELRLYPEAIFTGTLTAPDGEPLPHVLMSARRNVFNGSESIWIPVAQSQTDSHGRFRLPVPAGDYRLESMYVPRFSGTAQAVLPVAVPSGDARQSAGFIHIRSGEEQHFDLHPAMSRVYMVTASFDSGTGRGFPRITAHASNGTTISLPVHFSRYRDADPISMELPSGTYTLDISTLSSEGGMEQGEATITVADHDLSGLVFHLYPLPTLPVELQVDSDSAATSDNSQSGSPQPSLMQFGLMLNEDQAAPDSFGHLNSLVAHQGGSMAFTVPPGNYRLRARNNGGSAWYIKSASYGTSDVLRDDIVVAPGTGGTPILVTVSNQTASLQGTCSLNGSPTEGWVYLVPTTPSATTVFTARCNTQGVYSYSHLPPGSYQAVAFEQTHMVDYSNSAVLTPFASHVHTVILNAGDKPALDLDAVPEAEMTP